MLEHVGQVFLIVYWKALKFLPLYIYKPGHMAVFCLRTFASVCFWRDSPAWARGSSFTRFLDHTQRHTTVGRTPLDEWSARRRDLYLITHTTLTTDKRPCPRRDSNPQSQQARGRRPSPWPRGQWDRHARLLDRLILTHLMWSLIGMGDETH